MGFKDLFSSAGRSKSKTAKAIKSVTNPYAQSHDRYAAMETLLDIGAADSEGGVEAYVGLLRRFTISSTKSIEDEEEKGWAYRRLAAIGAPLLPALERFCLDHENIAWALRIVEDVANGEQEWKLLSTLLEAHPPGRERSPDKKVQLLNHVSEIDDPKVPALLAPYLDDPDETVRYAMVEALIDIGEAESAAPLIARLVNEAEDSLRLRARILDGLAERGWSVQGQVEAITPHLGSEHHIQGGKVHRR